MSRRKKKPQPSLKGLTHRRRLSRILSLISFLSLATLVAGWNLFYADLHGARPWVIAGVQLLPLLIVAHGVIRGKPQAHTWTCFIVNLYLIQGIQALMIPERQLYGALSSACSLVLFVSALLYVRWSGQYRCKAASERLRHRAARA